MTYAAIGSDGNRPVVWGLGTTKSQALADASRWIHDYTTHVEADYRREFDSLLVVIVTDGQAQEIERGEIDAVKLGLWS